MVRPLDVQGLCEGAEASAQSALPGVSHLVLGARRPAVAGAVQLIRSEIDDCSPGQRDSLTTSSETRGRQHMYNHRSTKATELDTPPIVYISHRHRAPGGLLVCLTRSSRCWRSGAGTKGLHHDARKEQPVIAILSERPAAVCPRRARTWSGHTTADMMTATLSLSD
jgi:hypothetical protein